MAKVRRYNFRRTEICRNCQGTGEVFVKYHPCIGPDPLTEPCEVCGGSGRVNKSTSVEITIEPYPKS